MKLFRHVEGGRAEGNRVLLVQAFSRYYDLASGGYSTKRENAEFAGRKLAEAVDRVDYAAVTLDLEPVRDAADPPADWREAVDDVARTVEEAVERRGDGVADVQ